jgi:hypothetical protein
MRRSRVPSTLALRSSASDRLRVQIDQLMSESLVDHFEEVARLAVRLVLGRAMEAEISELLSGRNGHSPAGELERSADRNVGATVDRSTVERAESPWARPDEELSPIQLATPNPPPQHHHDDWRRPEVEGGVRSGVNTLRAVVEAMAAVR